MSVDLDLIALDAATAIMGMYFESIPGVQLKAKIQCAVRDAMDAARPAAPVEAPLTDAEIFDLADDFCAGQAQSGNYLFRRLRLVDLVRKVEARIQSHPYEGGE